jgi:peroxiredoxin
LRQVSFDLREPMAAKGAADVKLAEVSIDYAAASPATQPAKQPGPADAARQFAWTPPANAVLASAATAPTASDDASAAQALVGKAAPDLSLPDLDDKTVKLASLHGSVVVLDFWATWCGPCVESLPNLDALYKEQSPHGLKAFAVDQQEDKDHVKAFVQKKGWSLPVLLDADGSVGQKYSADSIPETVIVGKDGVVKNVFVGVGPDTEDQIKAAVAKEMGQ